MTSWIATDLADVQRRAADWLARPALKDVLRAFGANESLNSSSLAAWSASVLDTRHGRERRDAPTVEWDAPRVNAIIEAAGQLGMMETDPAVQTSYAATVILGGAATGNRLRTRLVRDLLRRNVELGTVVLLASNRPISPPEHRTDPESAEDLCEWMHLLRCADDDFGPLKPARQISPHDTNISRDESFTGTGGTVIRLVVAGDQLGRRPTTPVAARLLLNLSRSDQSALSPALVVTSAAYVPYQFFAAVPVFIAGGVRPVEVIGTPTSSGDERLLAQRLGQEMHAAITWATRVVPT